MAIKSRQELGKLLLEIDNGDMDKIAQCMEKWNFKDHQSMMRFAISLLLVTEDKSIWIKSEGQQQPVAPAKDFLKDAAGK